MIRLIVIMPLMVLMIFASGGCQRETIAETTDPLAAREALSTVLERWRAGDPPGPGDAEARFADEDCFAGYQLTSFKISEDHKMHGVSVRYAAILSLRDKQDRPITKRVQYIVSTKPTISVVRRD